MISSLITNGPALYSSILLSESPAQSLDAVGDPLELILRLASNLRNIANGWVLILVRPLDLEGVELELVVEAVDVLRWVRGESADGVDEGHELVDVVPEMLSEDN